MDSDAFKPASQEALQPISLCQTCAGLRPVLLNVLQTGGVPPQMAEGIADILEEAGYQEFRPRDEFTLRRRKARLLLSTAPDSITDTLCSTSNEIAENPETKATHSRIHFERIAAHNHTHDSRSPFQLTQTMRIDSDRETLD